MLSQKSSEAIVNLYNNKNMAAEEFCKKMNMTDAGMQNYLKTVKSGEATVKGYQKSIIAAGDAYTGMNIKAKAASIGVGLLNAALNIGITLLASVVITKVVEWLDNFINAAEKTREQLSELVKESENITSEITNLEDKLKELNQQINNLNPITDEDDIKNLRLETAELNAQLAILKEKQTLTKEQANEAAKKSLNITSASKYAVTEQEQYTITDGTNTINMVKPISTMVASQVTQYEELELAMNAYKDYEQQILSLNEDLSNLKENTPDYLEKSKKISELSTKMSDARTHANELASSVQEQAKGLDENTNEGRKLKETIDEIITQYVDFTEEVNYSTDALNKNAEAQQNVGNSKPIAFDTSQAIEKLKELEDTMSSLDSAYASLLEGEKVDLSSLDGIRESFEELEDVDMDAINEALGLIANADTVEDAQEAMDSLCEQYVKASGILDGLTDSNKKLITSQLKLMGVENAEALVTATLEGKKLGERLEIEKLKNAEYEAIEAAYSNINALLSEADASDTTSEALFNLVATQTIFNNKNLDVTDKLKALEKLATAFGIVTDSANSASLATVLESKIQTLRDSGGFSESYLATLKQQMGEHMLSQAQKEYSSKFKNLYSYSGGSSSTSTRKNLEDTVETFDWLATAIARTEREITNLDNAVSATYKNWSKRNEALVSELSAVKKQIDLQRTAYATYMAQANAVELSDHYKSLVQNGGLKIEDIADETLQEQIQTYQEYYEKALEASDAVEELNSKLAELAKIKFDNISTKFDNKLQDVEHIVNLIEGQMDRAEERNQIAGKSFYEELINQEKETLATLEQSYREKMDAINEAVLKGYVEYQSEMWYEMKTDIDEVTESIQESNNELIKLEKNLKKVAVLKFNNLSEQFDNALGLIPNATDVLETYMQQIEDSDLIVGKSFYDVLLDASQATLYGLNKKHEELSLTFDLGVADGSIEEFSEDWYDIKEEISDVEKKIADTTGTIQELERNMKKVAMLEFSDIVSQFDNAIGLIQNSIDKIDAQIALVEARGYIAGEDFYQTAISAQESNIDALTKKYAELTDLRAKALNNGDIEKYDDNWYEMTNDINGVADALMDANTALVQYSNSLRDMEWGLFDRMQSAISGFADESNFLIELMSKNHELFEENGTMNDRGLAVQGLHVANYQTYLEQSKKYAEEIASLEREMALDPQNVTLLDRYNNLLELQRSAILNIEDEKAAIKDLASDGYDQLLSSLQKLINKRKDALRAEKDLYDYQKKIDSQTKDIASYKKQLEAYSGNNSEEAIAIIQKLQVSLKEAEENLEQTQYEKYLSDQEALMDDLYSQTEEWINTRLDDINGLMERAITATNESASTIATTITTDVSALGGSLTEHMTTLWTSSDGLNGIVSGVKTVVDNISSYTLELKTSFNNAEEKYGKEIEGLSSSIGAIDANLKDAKDALSDIKSSVTDVNADSPIKNVANAVDNVKGAIDKAIEAINSIKDTIVELNKEELVPEIPYATEPEPSYDEPAVAIPTSSNTSSSSAPSTQPTKNNNSTSGNQFYVLNVSDKNLTKAESENQANVTANSTIGYKDKKVVISLYGTGTNNAKKGLHMVSEQGDELIFDNDGNAILAQGAQLYPFEGGETVVPHAETEEILQNQGNLIPINQTELLSNMPLSQFDSSQFINTPKVKIPNITEHAQSVNNEIRFDLTLPNVKNYEEFVSKLQTDRRFERVVSEMMSSKMLGKNGYNKMKY